MNPADRRTSLRVPHDAEIQIESDGRLGSGRIKDISVGGAAIVTTEMPLDLRAHVTVWLMDDAGVGAQVMWRNQNEYGFRFDNRQI